MGGNAFKHLGDAAIFSRMSPTIYQTLKTSRLTSLSKLFSHVAVPPEDPEKADYGDVDFMLFGPSSRGTPDLATLKNVLGADHAVMNGGENEPNFAVAAVEQPTGPNAKPGERLYHQVDLNIFPDVQTWESAVFYNSYGDLGLLITLLARPYGLLYSNKGIRVR